MKNLRDVFLEELGDMYDAEQRIIKALPKLSAAATCNDLKKVIDSHLVETEGHLRKLEQIFECFDEKAKGRTCDATVGLLKEADEIASDFKGSSAVNAAIICALQKVEHYEIATYGCLREWAGMLEHQSSAELLQEILDQEKAANTSLTKLARARSNQDAMSEPMPETANS